MTEAAIAAIEGFHDGRPRAFQLRDDLLGVFGDPARTGKPVIGDLREGKRTVLIALAHDGASAGQSAALDRCVGNPRLADEDAAGVRAILICTGAVAKCEAMIGRHVKEALSRLKTAPITEEARQALAELAVTATFRSN